MATLLKTESNKQIILRCHHVFGRHSGGSNTLLQNSEASRLHASIIWNGSYWLLQDSSSNGTYINRKAVVAGVKIRLNLGDSIRFGTLSTLPWIFNNDDAPKSMLIPIKSDSKTIELDGIIVLPSEDSPQVTLYQSSNGQWLCENHAGIKKLDSGVKITAMDKSWYFINAEILDETKKDNPTVNTGSTATKANFRVSKNEEHVSLSLSFGNQTISLGERTHHYLLLLLARKRTDDHQSDLEENEQGWIDKNVICKQIGIDENHLNIQIYRFRKQLVQTRPTALQLLQLVERRRGEIRFGLNEIEIIGGFKSINF